MRLNNYKNARRNLVLAEETNACKVELPVIKFRFAFLCCLISPFMADGADIRFLIVLFKNHIFRVKGNLKHILNQKRNHIKPLFNNNQPNLIYSRVC